MYKTGIVAGLVFWLTACSGGSEADSDGASSGNTNQASGNGQQGGYSNSLPTCSEAALRISESIEVGMSSSEVRALVGRPRHIGLGWKFGTNSRFNFGPRVTFDASSELLSGFDIDSRNCDGSENAFIESANSLILTQDTTDYSDEIPTCFDAATRIAARVNPGMAEADVRRLVGKPNTVSTLSWEYGESGRSSTVSITTREPHVVTGYSTDCEGSF